MKNLWQTTVTNASVTSTLPEIYTVNRELNAKTAFLIYIRNIPLTGINASGPATDPVN